MAKVSDLFDVQYGHSLELNRLPRATPGEGIAFVSRQMGSNGISAWVQPVPGMSPAPAGELSCALGGNGVLTTHLQEQPYYTGRDVARLIPRNQMSKAAMLFYGMCIKANRYKYSYGRQANRSLRDLEVPNVDQLPSYVNVVDVDRFTGRDAALTAAPTPVLNASSGWQPFRLDKLFDIRKGKRLTKADMVPGNTAFISALDWNNGLRQRTASKPMHPAGVVTVNYNGNGVAEAFYQPEPFFASDDVNVLYPAAKVDAAASLFICAVIRQEKYRFSYGRKWNLERMKEAIIRLPAVDDDEPDYSFMSDYIGSLRFSSILRTSATSLQNSLVHA